MSKTKVVIQILPMVSDIDYLERTLFMLKQNSSYIDKDKFYIILDVALPTSSYLVDWENSILKQDYFINKLKNLEKYADWCDEYYLYADSNIKGCVDYCIKNINKYKDIDDMLWLDIDIMFNPYALNIILESSLEVKKNQSKYILTPECVKLWDGTWDVLVNDHFLNHSYGYEKQNDSILDTNTLYGDISLELVNGFKFGGSWFTLYSKELLDYINFPLDIEGYSPIDTMIMEFCKYIPNVTQYKIKNLVICEDYKHIDRTLYNSYLKSINRKEDPLNQISWKKMAEHLIKSLNQWNKH
jgi:hypothetical protein